MTAGDAHAVLRVGVIGAGVMGATHCRVLAGEVHGARVAAVADVDAERAAAVARAAGAERVHGDPLALVGDPGVDAVIVASSDATHEAFVLACLEAGTPVLCEKPLAATAEGCLRVVQAEAALGRRLVHVGFMRRYDRGYAGLKAAAEGGGIGAPLLMHCVHRNAAVPPAYTSDMLMTSSGVHEIDVARWLLGDEIVRVTVHAGRATSRDGGHRRDPVLLLLESAAGVLVDVEVFASAGYGYDIRCELVGETGTATLSPPRTVELRREGHDGAAVAVGFEERFLDAYRRELQAWVDGIAGGRSDGPSAWDGYAASAVADACVASLSRGGPCDVRLAPRPALYEAAPAPVAG